MSFRVEEQILIPLSDGCRLSARIWFPETVKKEAVPAILEYIPYRKADGTRVRDEPMHGFFCQAGYACVRVDMRGSGESDGHLADEYLKQEQDDAIEVIAWIAEQVWCTGSVGMMGKSWGGFNCLQVAARRPPALKAILTAYSTDNRYTDDIHYMGGCLLNDNLWWGSIMLAFQSRPPFPEWSGDNWREKWRERLESLPFFPALWLQHQRYDDYWKHGSICEDYSAVACPVLVVGGWVDSYTNAVPRLLEHLDVPRRGIIGPWGHVYPHDGIPGPAIGFLQEAVRWWDQWLKGNDTGIMNEAMLRAYIGDYVPPDGTCTYMPGHWAAEESWPSPMITSRVFHLTSCGGLKEATGEGIHDDVVMTIRSPQSFGRAGGEWMGTGCVGEMPVDQRLDDGGALVFETEPVVDSFEILGSAELRIECSSDSPIAQAVILISDVAETGEVMRISYQPINLTHRGGHETPTALTPGTWYDLSIRLNDCGHRFVRGHRLRVSIATAYWPMVWPAPYHATLSFRNGTVSIPVRCGNCDERDRNVGFLSPVQGPTTPVTILEAGQMARYSTQDFVTGTRTYVTNAEGGVFGEGVYRLDDIDCTIAHNLKRELSIHDEDPLSARYHLTQSYEMGREGWQISITTKTEMTSDEKNFYVRGIVKVFENQILFAEREWNENIRRDLM
ncbi:CocE/NonD family hydrolase [Acetobacter conturbans]|uniref:CocE/NonD family hydrolase n=1 Tax=Acetobacter conturbans TaxID=1737472 RepID=A0ABX0K760_9PROT|nr:CocE/NonD family hydrolase [Acetobacter conturbans]NHN90050.1 CocE/NonD family hydrolase [Acetobacter conturbans]